MILDINTTKREKIYLTLFSAQGGPASGWEFETKDQSADLLVVVESVFKKKKLSHKDLKGILVNIGPGSFTGVRVGVTVANTLAWTLDIPIYGYKEGEQGKILAKILKNHQKKFSKIVLPYYS